LLSGLVSQEREMEDAATFSVGDTVKLKSGGPAMTVEKVNGDTVACAWFDSAKLRREGKFRAAMIALAVERLTNEQMRQHTLSLVVLSADTAEKKP